MKANLFAIFGSLVLAGVFVAAQDAPSPAPASREPAPQSAPAPAPPAAPAPAPAPAPAQQPPAADAPVAAAAAAPAAAAPASAPKPQEEETTLTGCLVQGSGPTVFILENAKLASAAKNAKGQSYVLEISAPPDKIKTVVNHSVTIVGTAEAKAVSEMPSAGSKRSESDLPKLAAKRISPTSQTCSSMGD
jgi:hypothetical protein